MTARALLLHPWTLRVSRGLLAVVMLSAAIPKLVDPPGFAQSIFAYGLVPMAWAPPLALVLPWLEGLTALGLVMGIARRAAAALILGLMLLFIGALGINLVRGNPVDCGCFGAASPGKAPKTRDQRLDDMKLALLRDVGLALLALHALARPKESE